MNTVDHLIKKFGSQAALAKAAGVKQPSVWGWRRSGFVPAKRQQAVLEAARAEGIELQPADFFAEAS